MDSSSSSCPDDIFNPDSRLRDLVNISIIKADGTEIDVPEGRVILSRIPTSVRSSTLLPP
jgi:hypothetical protein